MCHYPNDPGENFPILMLLPRLLIQSAILTKFATKPLCASVWGRWSGKSSTRLHSFFQTIFLNISLQRYKKIPKRYCIISCIMNFKLKTSMTITTSMWRSGQDIIIFIIFRLLCDVLRYFKFLSGENTYGLSVSSVTWHCTTWIKIFSN